MVTTMLTPPGRSARRMWAGTQCCGAVHLVIAFVSPGPLTGCRAGCGPSTGPARAMARWPLMSAVGSTSNPNGSRSVDVLDVSDLRLPGGTSHSVAEEVRAQADDGWTTGLVQLNGPLLSQVSPLNPAIRRQVEAGRARLLVGRAPVQASLVVIRHPAVLQHAGDQLPPVEAEQVVVVANAAPADIDGHEHYQPEVVTEIARQRFGREPIWAPIGPLVRAAITGRVPAARLRAEDWVNVIDVDSWWGRRAGWRADRPVIGRHSRDSPQKWPADPGVLRSVYPVDGSMIVRVLGGAETPRTTLGKLPASWRVQPFGSQSPRDFLAGVDFFVYYHDPCWVEAFGRTILEAMASGVPAILPPHFEALFGEAARYAEPAEVAAVIEQLYADRDACDALAARAAAVARARFGAEAHRSRVRELIGGGDSRSGELGATGASPRRVSQPTRPYLLCITSNGAGMGHLTRLLAYARRTDGEVVPHFLSMSLAVAAVARYGFSYEYLPSAGALGMPPRPWHELFAERVSETISRLRPRAVVFDGTWPYNGIASVRKAHPDVDWIWSRRAMWRAGMNADQLAKSQWFAAVVEPGDFAAAYDRGVTVGAPARRVGPVTLLDVEEVQERADARRTLGLDPAAPVALVSIGAGDIFDPRTDLGAAVAALRGLGVQTCLTDTEINVRGSPPADVHLLREFPLSRRFRAFDLAISATGYNSFHELLRFGVPSLFVPNLHTSLDDQAARAVYAADRGLAHRLETVKVETATPLLADLLERGEAMVGQMSDLDPGNGAAAGAAALLDILGIRG